jgi:hypothetical protein
MECGTEQFQVGAIVRLRSPGSQSISAAAASCSCLTGYENTKCTLQQGLG